MPAWPERLAAELDANDQRAIDLTGGLDAIQLNWQPAPGAWSVGQCLEHLTIANKAYLAAIAASVAGKPASPVTEITPGWFGRWFIVNIIDPSSKTRRVRAPKKIVPGPRVELSVLDRFLQTNRGIRELIQRARDCDVNRVRFANPFVPLIRFTVGSGFEILSTHERLHLLQAERARQASGFPVTVK